MIALALLAAATAPQLGDLKTFGDWSVACDNTLYCETTALMPGDSDYENYASPSVMRAAGAAAPTMLIGLPRTLTGRHSIAIDGKRLLTTNFAGETDLWEIGGADTAKLIPALVDGHTLEVHDAAGKVVGTTSLAGMSASLRYIDDRQRRAGTVTALVAKGAKPPGAVPPAPALPAIRAAAVPQTEAAMPGPVVLAQMRKQSECETKDSASTGNEAWPLGGGRMLVLLACGAGAYNFSSAAYVLGPGGTRFAPATFDYKPDWTDRADGVPILVNAGWAPKTATLSNYVKGRGLGDCGSSESWVWDGARFRLIEATRMDECRGSINWLTVWRARAVR